MIQDQSERLKHYHSQMIITLVISILGCIFHAFVLHLFYITDTFFKPGQRIRSVFGASIVVANFFLYQIIKTSVQFYYNEYVGDYTFCLIDTFINVFLYEWFYMLIVLMFEVAHRDFSKSPMKNSDIYQFTTLFGLYSLVIGLLSVFLPTAQFNIDQTGTYCFLNLHSNISIIIFILLGIVLPTAYIIVILMKSKNSIKIAQNLLISEGSNSKAKVRQVANIKATINNWFIFLLVEAPLISYAIYNTINENKASVYYEIISIDIQMIYLSFSPLLIVIFVPDLQETFQERYIIPLSNMLVSSRGKHASIDVIMSANDLKYEDLNYWMEDSELKSIFFVYTKSTYTSENILFFDEIINYHKLSNQLIQLLFNNSKDVIDNNNIKFTMSNKNANSQKSYKSVSSVSSKLEIRKVNDLEIQLWCKMYEETCKIYKLYIEIPTAPLEINISDIVRRQLNSNLKIKLTTNTNNKTSNNSKNNHNNNSMDIVPLFPDISNLKNDIAIDIVEEYSAIFDSTFAIVATIIQTDIFPRFKKKKIFRESINQRFINHKL